MLLKIRLQVCCAVSFVKLVQIFRKVVMPSPSESKQHKRMKALQSFETSITVSRHCVTTHNSGVSKIDILIL
jgi:hypothetical protein